MLQAQHKIGMSLLLTGMLRTCVRDPSKLLLNGPTGATIFAELINFIAQ